MPHVPRRAFEDPDFLNSAEGRSVRILSEYLEPLRRLNQKNVWHTIVFFGSARIPSKKNAEATMRELEQRGAPDAELETAHRALEMSEYYEAARTLARMVTEWSETLPRHERLVVSSGGGGGIMEAANRGASEAGGRTVALNIQLPMEQAANPWVQDGLTFDFHYFFMRKFWFVYRAKAIFIFPGGFGTLDEFMESLTLTQTGRVDKHMPIILYGEAFWQDVINLDKLAHWGMIGQKDGELFQVVNTPEEAMEALVEAFTWHGDGQE